MNDKIKQIIPAPANMWAVYDGSNARVVCLALMEDGETIRAMVDMGDCGTMDFADSLSSFAGFSYDSGEPTVEA